MKAVIQRVSSASCTISGEVTGSIGKGFMILVGFTHQDDEKVTAKMAEKISKLRVFEDPDGKMNLSLKDVGGDILSISQFTLYADARKGNRPSFTDAMEPGRASALYDSFNQTLRDLGLHVETGVFGADMKIALVNDGPVTILLESEG